ncbi:MAG: hypothetical protein K1X67_24770 [Fimbriimonadaceae bacterium]|nr:hypothetical protein [Fimbriimonadaceae bacterium]
MPNFADPNAASFGSLKCIPPAGPPIALKLVGARLDIFRREGRILFRWHFTTNPFRYRREGASEPDTAAMTADVMLGPACPSPRLSYRVFLVSNPEETLASSAGDSGGPWLPFYGRVAMKGSSGGGN